MSTNKRSLKVYGLLVVLLAFLAALNVYLPQGDLVSMVPDQELPASRGVLAAVNALTMLVVYGGLGLLGLTLSGRVGFPALWDEAVSNRERFLVPALVGASLGVFLVAADAVFSRLHALGPLPHPPFPTSLVASATAGIGEEIIFRLFFVSFWVWLISTVLLGGRWQENVFWIVSTLSGVAFALGHLPSVMFLYGMQSVGQVPVGLLVEIVLLNGVISLFAAYRWRRAGFLAAVGVHFWTDVVWHVIWGACRAGS
ncbi:MAG: CPBP family glutamic-type intramembrane protease [Chloroflexota bacterium]|nr:CPBP family glutamic-type intramembrane protease [Chloroflexota bacterium]